MKIIVRSLLFFSLLFLLNVNINGQVRLKRQGVNNVNHEFTDDFNNSKEDSNSRAFRTGRQKPWKAPYDFSDIVNLERKKIPIFFSGNVRFIGDYRYLTETYPNTGTKLGGSPYKVLNFNGWGDNDKLVGVPPFILLNARANPVPGTSIEIGFNFTHIFSGALGDSSRSIRPWNNFIGRGEIVKAFGTIKIAAGNPFIEMGPLFGGFIPRRFMPFWRLPWDWYAESGSDWNKYEDFYRGDNIGIDRNFISAGRVRGFSVQGIDFPQGLQFGILYGSAQSSPNNTSGGLFSSKQTFGGTIGKKLGVHSIAVNGFINNGFIDNVGSLKEKQEIYSFDVNLNFEKIKITGNFGIGGFENPLGRWLDSNYVGIPYKSKLNEAILFKVLIPKAVLGLPIALNAYSIGKDISNSGAMVNTAGYNTAYELMSNNILWDVGLLRGAITQADQFSNNRRGLIMQTEFDIKKFKVSVTNQVAREVENRYNVVTFQQKLNDYSRSTFRYWDAESGPYNRLLYQYITLYERINITDSVVDYLKTFNMLDLNLRYKTSVFGRTLILTNFINYNSAGDKLSPIPSLTKKAFVRTFYNELMGYYHLHSKLALIGHVGFQRAVGNYRTELAANGKPINQTGWGLGAGLDYNFANKAGLYLRYLYMTHKDPNFTLDKFKGHEISLELKVFF
jgi:hypothetical protein